MSSTPSLPQYVERLTDPIGPPPSVFEDVTAYLFELRAATETLEEICRTHLNTPLGQVKPNAGVPQFGPASPSVWIGFTRYRGVYSDHRRDLGRLDYTEVVLMFELVIKRGATNDSSKSHWYAPALFLDGLTSIYPIATGRELYGLPKTRGRICWDTHNWERWAAVQAFDVMDDTNSDDPSPVTLVDVITVERNVAGKSTEQAPGASSKASFGGYLMGLRQFQDPHQPGGARSQSVVKTPYEISGEGRSIQGSFIIRFPHTKHFQLAKYLGLPHPEKPEYLVRGNDGWIFEGAKADFGDPKRTEVWDPGVPASRPTT